MRKLGDQWTEVIDGQEHMVKAVEGVCENCGLSHLCNLSADCPMDWGLIAKDLGILKNGCLPNCWGEYPRIEVSRDAGLKEYWYRAITRLDVYCTTDSYKSEQEAIDAWNRRE